VRSNGGGGSRVAIPISADYLVFSMLAASALPAAPDSAGGPDDARSPEGGAQEISDFYALIREYWAALSSEGAAERSFMLNFGYWRSGMVALHEAQAAFLQRILAEVPQAPQFQRGVEVGCGIGGISVNVLRHRAQVHMTGVDISPAQLALARANALERGVSERFAAVEGNSMDLPFADGAFDFLLCIESSFHYEDKPRFLQEALRTLRPGGQAVVADITCRSPQRVKFRQGNHFEAPQTYLRWMEQAGFELLGWEDFGAQVYAPLHHCVLEFNRKHRSPVGKYWAMVLSNYSQLAESGDMGYCLFSLRKPL
jgi:SAM-dependent methyltransferase